MGKKALCVNRADLWNIGITLDKQKPYVYPWSEAIGDIPNSLIDRDICETDPSTLQLIPYIILENPAGNTFAYTRGNATGEQRLLAKMSIGLGGHMDSATSQGSPEMFFELIRDEAAREIKEEVGITIDPSKLKFIGLLYEETQEVGRVHLGLACYYKLAMDEVVTQEEGHIENSSWLSFDELIRPEIYERLEIWSRTLIDFRSHKIVCNALNKGAEL